MFGKKKMTQKNQEKIKRIVLFILIAGGIFAGYRLGIEMVDSFSKRAHKPDYVSNRLQMFLEADRVRK